MWAAGRCELALKPDGGEVFVVNALSDSISEVITGTDDVQGAYMMGDDPVSGLVSRDNSLLYVGNLHSQNVIVYSIDDGRRLTWTSTWAMGRRRWHFQRQGHLLFVVDTRSGDVAVVRTPMWRRLGESSSPLFTLLPAGRAPNAIVDKAFKVQ